MYKISVPLINASLTEESIDKYVRELKEARAERVLMVPRGSHENLEEAKERGLSLRKNAEKFIEQGIEPAIWVGSTVGHGSPLAGVQTQPVDAKYQTLVNLANKVISKMQTESGNNDEENKSN